MDNIKNPIQPQDGLTDFDFEPVPDRSAIVDHIRPSMRYWPEVGKRLLKNKVAMFAVFLLLAIILMAIFGPILSPYEYDKTSLMSAKKPPSWQHLFGTDKVGRDIFTRVCMGTRTSLLIGTIGALIPYLLGMTIGAISGWFGGKVDMFIMRVVDIMLCIPSMIYMILILVVLGGSPTSLIIALAISGWMGSARGFRGRILQFKNREFVLAATTLGANPVRIVIRHILPNILGNIAVGLSSSVPGAIFMEAGMSYIGLGVTPPMTSLGQLSTDGIDFFLIASKFHLFLYPALVISIMIFAFFMFGNCIRDALDPRLRDEEYNARRMRRIKRELRRNKRAVT